MQIPSVGRIVHVPVDPAKHNGATIAPAIITRVWSDAGPLNVKVIGDNPDAPEWRTSVVLFDSIDDVPGDQVGKHYCYWPPRV